MHKRIWLIVSVLLLVGVWLAGLSTSALAQSPSADTNLIINGDFEQGFQDFGVGLGWGAFSNGNAEAGWSADSWAAVVPAGQYAQLIELRNAAEINRYAGIYQTVSVVPGQPYKLTIKGLIRSEEGSIDASNYGYRLQYGLDYNGDTAWELVEEKNWQELPWDEQPLSTATYRIDTFETTLTPTTERLTLFIRAWKKWMNNGSGLYNLDEISLVGPAPENFKAGLAPAAVSAELVQPASPADNSAGPAAPANPLDQANNNIAVEQPQIVEAGPAQPVPQAQNSQLPVSGQGHDSSINTLMIISVIFLVILLTGALTTMRRRSPVE
jgi:hypothetical protein